jgi:hypothetical protein
MCLSRVVDDSAKSNAALFIADLIGVKSFATKTEKLQSNNSTWPRRFKVRFGKVMPRKSISIEVYELDNTSPNIPTLTAKKAIPAPHNCGKNTLSPSISSRYP